LGGKKVRWFAKNKEVEWSEFETKPKVKKKNITREENDETMEEECGWDVIGTCV